MIERLTALLEHLQATVDPARQNAVEALHRRALNGEPVERLPVIVTIPTPEGLPFEPYPHHEIFDDSEKMLFNELVYAFNTSIASRDSLSDDLSCTIRANFGTVVMASMFGANVEQVDDNPPWVRHGDHDVTLEAVIDQDPLDFSRGWCPRVADRYACYQDLLSAYPELSSLIKAVLPDLQGPFDNLELIVGSGVFAELCMSPTVVDKALEVLATAQIGFARHLAPYVTDGPDGYSHQHATMIKGNILLRNDSVIMMSPQMYRDQVARHDERVLSELGGGSIHSCGKIDAHVPALLELPSIQSLDVGQSELNDMTSLYPLLKKQGIPVTRVKVAREDLVSGRIMEQYPTGVSLMYEAASLEDAVRTMDAYCSQS